MHTHRFAVEICPSKACMLIQLLRISLYELHLRAPYRNKNSPTSSQMAHPRSSLGAHTRSSPRYMEKYCRDWLHTNKVMYVHLNMYVHLKQTHCYICNCKTRNVNVDLHNVLLLHSGLLYRMILYIVYKMINRFSWRGTRPSANFHLVEGICLCAWLYHIIAL